MNVSPSISEYLYATVSVGSLNGIQNPSSSHYNSAFDMTSLLSSPSSATKDGFFAALYQTHSSAPGQSKYIVSFEASGSQTDAYGLGTRSDDAFLLTNSFPENLADDIDNCMKYVIGLAQGAKIPTEDIFVTGGSLGGTEAEYAMQQFSSQIGGGAAFNSTGLPQYSAVKDDPNKNSYNFTNYETYGDPVSNWASDALGGQALGLKDQDHFGSVVWSGAPWAQCVFALGNLSQLWGITNTQNGTEPQGSQNLVNMFDQSADPFISLHGPYLISALSEEGYISASDEALLDAG
jgi:hypothetical protein